MRRFLLALVFCVSIGLLATTPKTTHPVESCVMVKNTTTTSWGSGVVVGPNMVLTAAHVARMDPNIVVLADGTQLPIIKYILASVDAAILIVEGKLPPPLGFDATPLKRGDNVCAIGSPFLTGLRNSLCFGRIVNVDVEVDVAGQNFKGLDFMDVLGGAGMSGGPVIRNGKITGIMVIQCRCYLAALPVDQFVELLRGNGLQ